MKQRERSRQYNEENTDQFVTIEIDEDQEKVGPTMPFNIQRKSASGFPLTISLNIASQQKNSSDKSNSVRRVKPVPFQKILVPKINLTLKRQVSVSQSDKRLNLRRQQSFEKLADRSRSDNKSVSLTPRATASIPTFRGISVTKQMQSTNDPRPKTDCLQDSESSRQKQNFVSFKRTSLDIQKQTSTKPVFPKPEPLKNAASKKQKSSIKKSETQVQTKVKNSFQQRTSVAKNVQSPKRMIKLSDFGKSQHRSGHEDTKFNFKFLDSERKNTKLQDTKALLPLSQKVKSERVTNLNVLSTAGYSKHQCSTINLEIQQLERGEMVVKVSSGTESDDSMSLDVDELSEHRSQNDFGMTNAIGTQSFSIHSIFQMSNLNQKVSQFSQQSLTSQSKQDSYNSLSKIKKDYFNKTNSRQPPVSVQYHSNRIKSPQPISVTQFKSQHKHNHLNSSNWEDANIHQLTPSVISQANANLDAAVSNISIPINPIHISLTKIQQNLSETHGQEVQNSEQMGGRAHTSAQMNPTESRLSLLSSCQSQQNNYFESLTVESKRDALNQMLESGVTHITKMNSLGEKITKKTSQPKRQIHRDYNLQMLLNQDAHSRQTKVGFLGSAQNFLTQLPTFSPIKKIKTAESEFKVQPKQLHPVASKCACPKELFNDTFMICSYSLIWLKHVEDRTDLRIDYQRSKEMYQRVSNKKSGSDEKQIAVDIKRTFPEEPYFCSEEGRLVMTRLLNSISKHSSSAGYTQGMNNIAGSLLFHSDEVIAFELILRALNDYHLKEVHMSKLPGFYHHCEVLDALIDKTQPALALHFKQCQVKLIMFGQNWIMTLFTQVIPINLIMRFWCLFWRDEWVTLYKLILLILTQMKKQIMAETNQMAIQQVIYQSFALKAATNILSEEDQKLNQKYWLQQLELLEKGFNSTIDSEYIQKTMRQLKIY